MFSDEVSTGSTRYSRKIDFLNHLKNIPPHKTFRYHSLIFKEAFKVIKKIVTKELQGSITP